MHRLIYKSKAVARMSWKTVGPILEASVRNNDRDGLTGVLLIGKRTFLQVLEGDKKKVQRSYERIAADPRHCDVQVLSFDTVQERLFADWQMRGIGLFEFDPPLSEPLIRKYGGEHGEITLPDTGEQALALVQDIIRLENPAEGAEADER
jgi:hypothetical protein